MEFPWVSVIELSVLHFLRLAARAGRFFCEHVVETWGNLLVDNDVRDLLLAQLKKFFGDVRPFELEKEILETEQKEFRKYKVGENVGRRGVELSAVGEARVAAWGVELSAVELSADQGVQGNH